MTIWLTLIILLLLAGAGEWAARLVTVRALLTSPKMGSSHYQLGHKLALLDASVRDNGSVDCIMVGSSMVDVGFDPNAFQSGYQAIAGRDIHCFNFGIDASSAASTAAIVRILIENYQPRVLIFGTDARDYVVAREDPDAAVILDSPWIQYRQDHLSLEGWLLDISYFYRYRQHLSRLSRFNFEGTLRSQTKTNIEILINGFTPINKVSTYINSPPAPGDDSFEVTYYTKIFSSYRMLEDNLEALEQILSQNGSETQVIIVEMPVSDGLYYFFGNGESDYNRFIAQVSEIAEKRQVLFWRTEPLDTIPDDGWFDYSHMNTTGAEIFSMWLGRQIGIAEDQGSIVVFQP
jgi:hypothetical protein